MAQEEATWLIKSSGRVLGPFRAAKIAELLRTREISVLDEAATAMRRWQTIQYHPGLREIVEQLRRSNLSEKTEAIWTSSEVTNSPTVTVTINSDPEITADVSDPFSSNQNEIVIHQIDEKVARPLGTKQVGRFQPQAGITIQRQVEKTTRRLWAVTILVLLAVAAFVAQKKWNTTPVAAKPHNLATLRRTVVEDLQVGDYQEALRELKTYFPDPMQSGDLGIYMGSLLVQVDGQTVLGRRILSSVIGGDRPEQKQAFTGVGLADLIEGQLDSAVESFNQALSLDPAYIPALLNTAWAAQQKGDFVSAHNTALKVLETNPRQGEAYLIWTLAELQIHRSTKNMKGLALLSHSIKEYLANDWDFVPEIGLYDLYLDLLNHGKVTAAMVRQYLDRDPHLTSDHRHGYLVFKGIGSWAHLIPACLEIAGKMEDHPYRGLLIASCYSQDDRWDQARRYIDMAVQQAPKDPLVQAWYSYVLRESRESDQSSVVLGRASELNRNGEFLLPTLLQARFCLTMGDLECARVTWAELYSHDPDFLPAVAGMAWVAAQRGSRADAQRLLKKGLKLSGEYIPLLRLQQKAERENWPNVE